MISRERLIPSRDVDLGRKIVEGTSLMSTNAQKAGVERACQLIPLQISKPLKQQEIYGKPTDLFAHSDKPIPTKTKKKS